MLNYDDICSLPRFIKVLLCKEPSSQRMDTMRSMDKYNGLKIYFVSIWSISVVLSLLRWLITFPIWLGYV